jgi:patched 1 protein/patched 2 protein
MHVESVQGMGVVAFAVIAGFGLTALCGISFSPLAGSVVPFLALGLGTYQTPTLKNFLDMLTLL